MHLIRDACARIIGFTGCTGGLRGFVCVQVDRMAGAPSAFIPQAAVLPGTPAVSIEIPQNPDSRASHEAWRMPPLLPRGFLKNFLK
ncbi:hypothetical protein ASZ90_010505 [hydrocarbon metagenome]|uniref:Uncharacterized protein n=1 Tax=hydrocarbon metagenome TaxID=938273 RepID=A0A0W8FFW5_9ZZZZ